MIQENAEQISRVADAMEKNPAQADVLIGFDGFVDEIIRLVDTRQSVDHYTPIPTIAEFGRRVSAAAGLSANIEMVPEQVKLGGNGPIMANAMAMQGYGVRYVGAIGAGSEIHPVFQEFAGHCKEVISLCDAAHTDALEFDDGKIMLGKMNTLPGVNWDNLMARVTQSEMQAKIDQVALVGCVNWTMLPNMNSILKGLGGLLANQQKRSLLFIDLTDPRKRTHEDIRSVLHLLAELQEGVDVVLGLNENESMQVADVLFGIPGDDLTGRAQRIRTQLGVYQVVIHPTRSAAVATVDGEWYMDGPFTPKPKLTTGAGDNFNAGYCNGLLSGLDPKGCLISGVCTSGFYVRNCRSATRPELVCFLRQWADVDGGTLP